MSGSYQDGWPKKIFVRALGNAQVDVVPLSDAERLREGLEGLLGAILFDDENPCGFLATETERIKARAALNPEQSK